MSFLNVCKWTLCICVYIFIYACNGSNIIKSSQQSHQKDNSSKNCLSASVSNTNCLSLPYFNNKNATIELLTFIFHGWDSAHLTDSHADKMKIIYQQSTWRSEYIFQVFFFDDNQFVMICPETSSDWFGTKKYFLSMLQQQYLNVARKG
jgi:hypothetical protein